MTEIQESHIDIDEIVRSLEFLGTRLDMIISLLSPAMDMSTNIISVSATVPTQVVYNNPRRKMLLLSTESASMTLAKDSGNVNANGVKIQSNGFYSMPYSGPLWAIAGTAGNLHVAELIGY